MKMAGRGCPDGGSEPHRRPAKYPGKCPPGNGASGDRLKVYEKPSTDAPNGIRYESPFGRRPERHSRRINPQPKLRTAFETDQPSAGAAWARIVSVSARMIEPLT